MRGGRAAARGAVARTSGKTAQRRCPIGFTGLLVLAAGMPCPAQAQRQVQPQAQAQRQVQPQPRQSSHRFDLPAQPVADSLEAFGRIVGRLIVFPYRNAAARQAPAIAGLREDRAVLAMLARAAGLAVVQDDARTIVLAMQGLPPAQEDRAEIVVIARKVREPQRSVPQATSAVGAREARRLGISGPDGLVLAAPNLIIDRGDGRTGINIALRGVQDNKQGLTQTPGIAMIVDGIQQLDPRGLITPFFDIDHIEVQRGPQGTLYGAASPGGVINIVSRRPVPQWDANAQAEVGNFATRRATLVLNAPLAEGLALRLAGNGNDRDGYVLAVNADGSRAMQPALNAEHNRSARASLAWSANAVTDVLASATYTHSYDSASSTVPYSAFAAARGSARRSAPATPVHGNTDDTALLTHIEANGRLGASALQLVLGYGRVRYNDTVADGGGVIPPGGPGWIWFPINGNTRTWSGEVRLHNAATASPLGWTLGLSGQWLSGAIQGFANYVATSCADFSQGQTSGGQPLFTCQQTLPAVSANLLGQSYVNSRTSAQVRRHHLAGYGTLRWQAGRRLALTVGARLAFDAIAQRSGTFQFITWPTYAPPGQPGSTYYGNPCPLAKIGSALCSGLQAGASAGFPGMAGSWGVVQADLAYRATKLTWKAGLDWHPDPQTTLYANLASGYKPGGFNAPGGVRQVPCCFAAENLVAGEIGAKAAIGTAWEIDSTAFFYDYRDQQIVTTFEYGNGNFTTITGNTPTRIYGMEHRVSWSLAAQDNLTLEFNLLHTAYGRLRAGENVHATSQDWRGVALDKAPGATAALSYRHTFDLGHAGSLALGLRSDWSSGYWLNVVFNAQRYRQRPYHRTGIDLTWRDRRDRWEVQLFASNLEDSIQMTDYFGRPDDPGNGNVAISQPRLFGLRIQAWPFR